jgi:hypothetical protein
MVNYSEFIISGKTFFIRRDIVEHILDTVIIHVVPESNQLRVSMLGEAHPGIFVTGRTMRELIEWLEPPLGSDQMELLLRLKGLFIS